MFQLSSFYYRTLTFLGFYMNYNKWAKSLTFRRGSEVGQESLSLQDTTKRRKNKPESSASHRVFRVGGFWM